MSITQPAASFTARARLLDLGEHVADPAGDQLLVGGAEVGAPPDLPVLEPVEVEAAVEHHHDVVLALRRPPRAAAVRW